MTAGRIDRILMGLGALLILISSYQLFFISVDNGKGLKLGTLSSTLSVVKTKNAVALDWRDATSGNELTENQLIYTDNESSAEVIFNEGSSLEIGENSLVKLRSAGAEQGIVLSKGFIRAKLEGGKPLKVQMNGEDYLLSGKDVDIQINIQNEKGEIGVITGEVKIQGAGFSENLNSESALEISGNVATKKAIYFKTLTPGKSETKYVSQNSTSITFSWEPSEAAKVFISKKPNLENAEIFEGASGLIAELTPALYYFKVESNKGTSLVSTFRIIQEKAPKILRPLNGEVVSVLEEPETKILLQWKNDEKLNYQIEWNDNETNTKTATVSGGSAMVNITPNAPFKWRVKNQDENRPKAVWSKWQEVRISLIPKPLLPTDLIPHEVEYQTYEKPNEKIELSWKSNSKVELEIKDPAQEITSKVALENSFDYTAKTGGKYSWRVRAIDSHLRSSEWSDWKTFSLVDLSNQKKAEVIKRIQLKKPDQSVTFNWEAASGSKSVFELSKDSDFKKIVKRIEVSKESTQVNIPEVGSYFWRSRQYLPDGTFNVSEPKRVIIEPVPAPSKPVKLPDLEVPLEDMPVKTSMLDFFFNFLIASAHADEIKGFVRVDLPVKDDAKGYVVRIFRNKKLTELVFEEQLSTKTFEWLNASPGIYYWQYAVIDYWDRKSQFSDASQLTVKGDPAPAPVKSKLISPIHAAEIDQGNLVLKWTDSSENIRYVVEISDTEDFTQMISKKETTLNELTFSELNLEAKLYYWRVNAYNKKKKSVLSNTGRFTILPPLERTVIADDSAAYQKKWSSRGFVAWAPSIDSYKFSSNNQSGDIDGSTKMSALVSGTIFKDKYALNGELLRQIGEVFEGESYLFQRLLVDGIKTWNKGNHRYGVGFAVGQSTGQSYEIDSALSVTAESVSGLSYGAVFRNYFSFNQLWEMQGKVQYLLGEITQLEFGADAIRKYKDYLLIGGLSYSSRDYELSSGKQTSMKLTLGFGKEF
jgi:hypothetical protein